SLITIAHHKFRIIRIKCEECTFATGRISPTAGANSAASQLSARNRNRRVVLLPSIDSIRKLVINVDAIKLRGGHVVLRAPALTAIKSYCRATVVGDDEVV